MYIVVIIMFLAIPLIMWGSYKMWEKEKNERAIESYQQTIKTKDSIINNLKAQVSKANSQISTNNSVHNSLISSLQNKCNSLTSKLLNHKNIKSQQDSMIVQLQSKLSDMEACCESKEYQIKVLSESLDLCNREKVDLEIKASDTQSLLEQIDKLKEEKSKLSRVIKELKDDLAGAITQNTDTDKESKGAGRCFKQHNGETAGRKWGTERKA